MNKSMTKLNKAQGLHKTVMSEITKQLTEKKTAWNSKRENHFNIRRKEENARL
jgi:hypothetical protein